MILRLTDDFDPQKIADSGQCFRWTPLPDGGWRILHGGRRLILREAAPQEFDLDCGEAEYAAVWRPYLDLDEDYAQIRARIDPEADPFLYAAAEAQRGLRILRQNPWEALVSFIISQNRNIPAIRKSIELLCRAAGTPCADYFAFPSPQAVAALPDGALSACKLGYRAPYLRAAAESVLRGETDLAALRQSPPAEALEALLRLRGVGVKVASCVQLFGLHQLDAFPIDVWMRRVLDSEYPGGYPADRYSPYNGVYQQYMFAYYRERKNALSSAKKARIDHSSSNAPVYS